VKKASTSASVHDWTARADAGTGADALVAAPDVVGLVSVRACSHELKSSSLFGPHGVNTLFTS
jgi:hypothetical protein